MRIHDDTRAGLNLCISTCASMASGCCSYLSLPISAAYFGEPTLHGSLIFLCILGALTAFVLDYLFKSICTAKALEKKDNVPLRNKEEVCLLFDLIMSPTEAKVRKVYFPLLKTLGSLNSQTPSYNATCGAHRSCVNAAP